MSPPSCPAGPSRHAPWWASTCRSPPPCSGRATTPSPRTWSGPRRTSSRRRRPLLRMAKLGPEPDRWLATVVPDREGLLDLPRRGVERPAGHLAARRRGEGRGRPGRRGPGQRPRGGRPAARPGRRGGRRRARATRVAAAAAALRDTSLELTVADRPRAGAGAAGVPARAPRARAGHAVPRVRGLGRPAAGALRLLVRVLPALRGPGRRRQADPRHLRHRAGPAARDRRHGLRRRLPAADPPDRHGQPQGPEHHAVPRRQPARDRPGRRRLAVGDRQRRGRPRRRPPAAGHDGGLPGLRRPHPRAGHGGGAGLRAAGRARPPLGRRATRSGSPPSPTARSPTRRTRRRSTRTSTRSTSTTTPRASTPSACG